MRSFDSKTGTIIDRKGRMPRARGAMIDASVRKSGRTLTGLGGTCWGGGKEGGKGLQGRRAERDVEGALGVGRWWRRKPGRDRKGILEEEVLRDGDFNVPCCQGMRGAAAPRRGKRKGREAGGSRTLLPSEQNIALNG